MNSEKMTLKTDVTTKVVQNSKKGKKKCNIQNNHRAQIQIGRRKIGKNMLIFSEFLMRYYISSAQFSKIALFSDFIVL